MYFLNTGAPFSVFGLPLLYLSFISLSLLPLLSSPFLYLLSLLHPSSISLLSPSPFLLSFSSLTHLNFIVVFFLLHSFSFLFFLFPFLFPFPFCRYYGESLPFGAASLSPPNIRYLTIEHALADYSVLLSALPDLFSCPNKQCKVVLFGGSYGGMLAVWHRFKYPHLSVGVISAGAPIDLYPGEGKQVLFWNATLHTFSKYGGQRQQGWDCAKVVDWTLDITRRYAQTSGGLSLLSNVFHSCDNLTNVSGAGQKLLFYIQVRTVREVLFDSFDSFFGFCLFFLKFLFHYFIISHTTGSTCRACFV